MRVIASPTRGISDGHVIHSGDGAIPGFSLASTAVDDDRFRDLISDAHDRIQSRHRLLKNHSDRSSAQSPHFGFSNLQQIAG